MDYSEAKAINDFLEVDEILGSVVVRRQIQPIDAKTAPSFPTVIKKNRCARRRRNLELFVFFAINFSFVFVHSHDVYLVFILHASLQQS